ncbi:MAG TPA: NAD(P)H-hydrate dehydratase, partial [Acidimicrobiales bacterium]|nr:NAD(P)H-hydrate dehydratase [Acidimicrobiales bacterium]
ALASRGAQRAGAGYVRLSTPGSAPGERAPVEVVGTALPSADWAAEVVDGLGRFAALVIGPGLGTGTTTATEVRKVVGRASVPTVVDGDALTAIGRDVADLVGPRSVLTPHDGEYERLTGHTPGADRIAAARELASLSGATVLLKGSTTVVAAPDGHVLISTSGDARLATAGTGDVLSGVIGALLAQGVTPLRAAAAGAWLHGRAAALGPARGLVASDVADLVPEVVRGALP